MFPLFYALIWRITYTFLLWGKADVICALFKRTPNEIVLHEPTVVPDSDLSRFSDYVSQIENPEGFRWFDG